MPIIVGLIIIVSTLIPVYKKFINNKKNSNPPKIERIQNYTMEQIHNSTLSEKYGKYDYPDNTEIEFNNCRYKITDNKSGGRKFEPLNNCPPLILTPIPFEKYLKIFSPDDNSFSKTEKNKEINNQSNLNNINLNNNINKSDLIDCKINDKCGGGYVKTTQSECLNKICCQTTPDKWEFITKELCDKKITEYKESLYKIVYLPHNNQNLKCLGSVSDKIYEASRRLKNAQETFNKMIEAYKNTKESCLLSCKTEYEIINNNFSTYLDCNQRCENEFIRKVDEEKNILKISEDYFNDVIKIADCR